MKVPFVSFKPLEKELDSDIRAAFARVYENSWYIDGKEDRAFEEAFAAYCDCRYCIGVGNGLDALMLILKALDIGEGDEVICEAYMKGVEITCGVYKTKNKAVAFPITEVVTSNEFFDYDAKYNGQVDEITPARIPDEVRDAVQAMTLKIYDILGCKGIIRVDYILTEGWTINLLEVNTTPGMTATSFIPQQVRAAGLDIKDVLTEIIEESFA